MVRAIGIGIGMPFGGKAGAVAAWAPVTGSAVHLDFVNQKYYWNGAERLAADFTAFTGGTFSNGLVTDGTATNRNINILVSTLNIAFPCALICAFTPASVTGDQVIAGLNIDTSNLAGLALNGSNRRVLLSTANVSQASQLTAGAAIGVKSTIGGNFETNNILQSVNGSTGAAADTVATLFTPTNLLISERPSDTLPFIGTIHHVVIASGAKTQAELNTLTAAVHAL
jgi:hypothetical protein